MITAALVLWLALQGVSPEGAQHMQAGVEAHKQGHLEVAISEFRKATESDPSLAEAFLDLGGVSLETRDYPAAIAALQHALKLSPELAPRTPPVGLCPACAGLRGGGHSSP